MLPYLNSPNIKLGVASRTSTPNLARDLLKGLHIPPKASFQDEEGSSSGRKSSALTKKKVAIDVFDGGLEIYEGSKMKHFASLHKRTGIPYEDMLFFDDESRNLETEELGLTMMLIEDGVTWEKIGQGVELWRSRRSGAQ